MHPNPSKHRCRHGKGLFQAVDLRVGPARQGCPSVPGFAGH